MHAVGADVVEVLDVWESEEAHDTFRRGSGAKAMDFVREVGQPGDGDELFAFRSE